MHSHTYRKGVGWWGKRKIIGDWDNTSPAAFQHVPDMALHCPEQYAQLEWEVHIAVAVAVQTHAQNKICDFILFNIPSFSSTLVSSSDTS